MREIYVTGIDWNEEVSIELTRSWNSTCAEINNVRIKFPRAVLNTARGNHTSKVTLWLFRDASNLVIPICAFLRQNDTYEVTQLISGKSKLTQKNADKRLEMPWK